MTFCKCSDFWFYSDKRWIKAATQKFLFIVSIYLISKYEPSVHNGDESLRNDTGNKYKYNEEEEEKMRQ